MKQFHAEPRPERATAIGNFQDQSNNLDLVVGIQTITHSRSGLAIVPTDYIVIALGDEQIDIPTHFARALAARLIEFSDFLERKSNPSIDIELEAPLGE